MQTFHPEVSTKNSIATALALCSALLLTGAPMQAAAQGGWARIKSRLLRLRRGIAVRCNRYSVTL